MNPIRAMLLKLLIGRATVAHNVITDGSYISIPSSNVLIGNVSLKANMHPMVAKDMGCGYACGFTDPYGFVPEAGCPIHDNDEFLAQVARL